VVTFDASGSTRMIAPRTISIHLLLPSAKLLVDALARNPTTWLSSRCVIVTLGFPDDGGSCWLSRSTAVASRPGRLRKTIFLKVLADQRIRAHSNSTSLIAILGSSPADRTH
jgi:hypothetical protein